MSSVRLLSGALLYDGAGSAPFPADLLIGGGRILRIAPHGQIALPGVSVDRLDGLSISPGWIDAHGHSDASLLAAPEAFGKISQGITTEIAGNCGLSAFPVRTGEVHDHLKELYAAYNIEPDWPDFTSYAAAVDARRPAINLACLCGHNTLRANILGYENRPAAPRGLAAMNALLAENLRQGAAGFSTGLLYTPGCFASEDELGALLQCAAPFHGPYATHLRSEGESLEEALAEALRLAHNTGITLHISHLKAAGPANWRKLPAVLARIEEARGAGMNITADCYPYTYSQTSLSVVLDAPFDVLPDAAVRDVLRRDPAAYAKARTQLANSRRDWSRVLVAGESLAAAANTQKIPPADLILKLLTAGAPGVQAAFGGLSEDNLNRILARNWVCCGTDETARPRDYSLGRSHPRGFGSFPRFITRLRQQGVPMARIIARLTALPARIFALKDRGVIAPGAVADLTVFDEAQLDSAADFQFPHTPAAGIRKVYVSGFPAYDGETRRVAAPGRGRVLRGPDLIR